MVGLRGLGGGGLGFGFFVFGNLGFAGFFFSLVVGMVLVDRGG